MAKVVVVGAGIAGHTAALNLRHHGGKNLEIVVISPNSQY
jgi:sulfide:quinone oxidoreductase